MSIPLQFAIFTIVRKSSYDLTACWILAQASSLVTWALYEMCRILWYGYSSCKSSIAQPHRCTQTSPGNCPETETCMVQACHTTASPKPSFRAPSQVGNAVVGRGNAGCTTSKSGHLCLCQNWFTIASRTKDWKQISAELSVMSPDDPVGQRIQLN